MNSADETLRSLNATPASRIAIVSIIGASLAIGSSAVAQTKPASATKPASVASEVGPANLYPYQPGIDVQHYDIAVTLPERGTNFSAAATLTVNRKTSVDSLILDLRTLTVDSVSVQGSARAFSRDTATIRIGLKPTDGARFRVSVKYHGTPQDGLIIREDSTRGWSAFGDNWPNRGRYWIPSVDHPSDKATVNWTVIAPKARSVVANGVRVSQAPEPGNPDFLRTRFTMRQPIPVYLMVIAAAQMFESPIGKTACGSGIDGACVPQSVWTFADSKSFVPGPFARVGEMVELFAKLGNSFPYEKLDHLQSATRFGGMENATAIFYSDDGFKKRQLGEGTVAHETAHQWFGDAVTPRRWQDLWLSEGFASYWAPLFARKAHGDSAFYASLKQVREQIINAKVVAARPVVDTVGAATPLTLLNENSYQKGAFVLHMLHDRFGDSVFFGAIRDYQHKYRHGSATTDELRALLEARSKTSLKTFFDQWLHRPGFADLKVEWHADAAKNALVLDVVQGTTYPPFFMPLTVVVRDANGAEETVRADITAVEHQTVSVPLRKVKGVSSAVVDPNVTVLGKLAVTQGK